MTVPTLSHDYAITSTYVLPDDAWCLELEHVPGQRTVMIATVPDEDPAREPTVWFGGEGPHCEVPYEVLRWFTDRVGEEVRASRAWMGLRPELVEVIHRLRQEYLGSIDDEDLPDVLAELRVTIPEADLPAVLEAAFGRGPEDLTD
ncbi:hypothetical protein [Kitasatospora sp. NPDC004289]